MFGIEDYINSTVGFKNDIMWWIQDMLNGNTINIFSFNDSLKNTIIIILFIVVMILFLNNILTKFSSLTSKDILRKVLITLLTIVLILFSGKLIDKINYKNTYFIKLTAFTSNGVDYHDGELNENSKNILTNSLSDSNSKKDFYKILLDENTLPFNAVSYKDLYLTDLNLDGKGDISGIEVKDGNESDEESKFVGQLLKEDGVKDFTNLSKIKENFNGYGVDIYSFKLNGKYYIIPYYKSLSFISRNNINSPYYFYKKSEGDLKLSKSELSRVRSLRYIFNYIGLDIDKVNPSSFGPENSININNQGDFINLLGNYQICFDEKSCKIQDSLKDVLQKKITQKDLDKTSLSIIKNTIPNLKTIKKLDSNFYNFLKMVDINYNGKDTIQKIKLGNGEIPFIKLKLNKKISNPKYDTVFVEIFYNLFLKKEDLIKKFQEYQFQDIKNIVSQLKGLNLDPVLKRSISEVKNEKDLKDLINKLIKTHYKISSEGDIEISVFINGIWSETFGKDKIILGNYEIINPVGFYVDLKEQRYNKIPPFVNLINLKGVVKDDLGTYSLNIGAKDSFIRKFDKENGQKYNKDLSIFGFPTTNRFIGGILYLLNTILFTTFFLSIIYFYSRLLKETD